MLFVDIVGFTQMAEHMEPEAVVTMLHQFHDQMTAQIFDCGGTVEKYIGDAIFAVWGLPEAGDADAANALRCADGMITALAGWNAERAAAGENALAIGIGLHHGPAVIGDVGSERSISFTVIGDTVNTASRLQVLTRDFTTPLVVSDALVAALEPSAANGAARLLEGLQDRGEQTLRGRSAAVRGSGPARRPPGKSEKPRRSSSRSHGRKARQNFRYWPVAAIWPEAGNFRFTPDIVPDATDARHFAD